MSKIVLKENFMFQWSEIVDKVSGFIETINTDEQGIVDNVFTQLSDGGLNVSELEGLNFTEVLEKIDLANVDLSEFNPEQITMALEALNINIPEAGIENLGENGTNILEWLQNK